MPKPKKTSSTKRTKTVIRKPAPKVESPAPNEDYEPLAAVEPEPTLAAENPHIPEEFKAKLKAKPTGPTPGSLARRKRALIDELKSENVSRARQIEVRAILASELADVPILNYHELKSLGD